MITLRISHEQFSPSVVRSIVLGNLRERILQGSPITKLATFSRLKVVKTVIGSEGKAL